MPKSPKVEEFLDCLSKAMGGPGRKKDRCSLCGSISVRPQDFRDNLSRREYEITRACQACQDSVYEGSEE